MNNSKNNAQVNVTEITVNGIKYTTTRPGYYYKKEDGKQTRISKAEWEQAFDQYIKDAADEASQWDAEDEIKERERKQAESDKDAEKAVNKKKTTRRPKDIAYEGNGVTLTAKQVKFIQLMPRDDFYENGLDSSLWIDVFCDTISDEFNPMAVGAMVSTLREKELIYVVLDSVNGRKAKWMAFTDLGKQVAKDLGLN